jgi:hypothetical protein
MMIGEEIDVKKLEEENAQFFEKTERALKELFNAAKKKSELHFALALSPEVRGYKSKPASTTMDLFRAFDKYIDFINEGERDDFKLRTGLSFYCQLAEASGFYEVPKKMLLVVDTGLQASMTPFAHLATKHKVTGNLIAPNTNKIFKDLAGHAKNSGFDELSEVFRDAFNHDLRNAYAHGDYLISEYGLWLSEKTGGAQKKLLSFPHFYQAINRGIGFFEILRNVVRENVEFYITPRFLIGRLVPEEPLSDCQIYYLPEHYAFVITGQKDYWRWVTSMEGL